MKKFENYHHVDNGGPKLTILFAENDEEAKTEPVAKLQISEGYLGYSNLTWELYEFSPKMLRDWANQMILAANYMEGNFK